MVPKPTTAPAQTAAPAKPAEAAKPAESKPAEAAKPAATTAPAKPAATAAPATGPGAILLADNFDAPDSGKLPRSSGSNSYRVGYQDGEYVMQDLGPLNSSNWDINRVVIPGDFRDATFAFDVRIPGDPNEVQIGLLCRIQKNQRQNNSFPDAYAFRIMPAKQQANTLLWKDDGNSGIFPGSAPSSAVRGGNATNHVEVTCAGNRFTATVNGQEVFSRQDDTFQAGGAALELTTTAPNTGEVRIDNLVVTQR